VSACDLRDDGRRLPRAGGVWLPDCNMITTQREGGLHFDFEDERDIIDVKNVASLRCVEVKASPAL
jgi:hypothetical protein